MHHILGMPTIPQAERRFGFDTGQPSSLKLSGELGSVCLKHRVQSSGFNLGGEQAKQASMSPWIGGVELWVELQLLFLVLQHVRASYAF